jgi:hypothetical protein
MKYSFLIVDINEWESFISQYTEVNIFGTTNFLKTTASVYKYNLDIRIVLFNNKPILAIPLFTSANKVMIPNHYYYQYIWEKVTSKESWTQIEAWDFLLKELQKKYSQIKLRLPIHIKDLRPFIWNNFEAKVRYTYQKDIEDLRYNQNINRIINKTQNEYKFKKNCDWEANWSFHNLDLLSFGVRKSQIGMFLKYLKAMNSIGMIKIFNAYHEDKFITSIVAIVDIDMRTAYFPLIGTSKNHLKNGLSSLVYNYAMKQLVNENIRIVDFCGANLKSISKYKSNFLPHLLAYYEVSFFKYRTTIILIIKNLKMILKRFFSFFS